MVLPWASVTGSSSSTMVDSTSQNGLRVAVTDSTDSGTWISMDVVGDSSQPWPTLKVTTVEVPAAALDGVAVTWAPAGEASERAMAAVAAGGTQRRGRGGGGLGLPLAGG